MFKGVLDLLKSLRVLMDEKIDFFCEIVGEEGDISKEQLTKNINLLGLNSFVNYLGPKFGIDKKAVLEKADLMLYPTQNDAMPLVIIEAFQFSIPVIANKIGAIDEIIDDSINGFIVSKEPGIITQKIKLLNNNRDLLYKMGQAARKKYEEKYTFSIFENNLKNVFEDLLKRINGANFVKQ